MNARIGLITTMSPDSTWPDHVVNKVKEDHNNAWKALSSLGFDMVKATNDLCGNMDLFESCR